MKKRMINHPLPRSYSSRPSALFAAVVFAATVFLNCPASAQSRRMHVGETVPQFTATTLDETPFEYTHSSQKVLLICFLSADQKRSKDAADDLMRMFHGLKCKPEQIDFLVVTDKAEAKKFFEKNIDHSSQIEPKIVVDKDFQLWGTFGIIALPTAVLADSENKVAWVEVGHSYDFFPRLNAKLSYVLGIGPDIDPDEAGKVKTVSNNTERDRIVRNIQMAKILEEKGKYDSALIIAKKNLLIDPNSINTKLMIGQLYCLSGDAPAALEVVKDITPDPNDRYVQASLALVKGWASRRMDKPDEAEKYLLDAVRLDPLLPRCFFELGNLYRQTKQNEKAAEAYHSGLTLILGREQ